MGRLTTHVLDTRDGRPAGSLSIELLRIDGAQRVAVKSIVTNDDGRADEPLLEGLALQKGVYELLFHAGDYFRAQGVDLPEPAFVDVVSIRFGVADESAHYHVPLLVTPWSYSTYRGS